MSNTPIMDYCLAMALEKQASKPKSIIKGVSKFLGEVKQKYPKLYEAAEMKMKDFFGLNPPPPPPKPRNWPAYIAAGTAVGMPAYALHQATKVLTSTPPMYSGSLQTNI